MSKFIQNIGLNADYIRPVILSSNIKLHKKISQKQKITKFFASVRESLKTSSRFTIHPFRSLHARHLLPLSLNDYVSRFGLELVVLGIATICVLANITLGTHHSTNKDQSVIFSFLQNNPELNSLLISHNETTTILAQADQWISSNNSSQASVVLASSKLTTPSDSLSTIQEHVLVKTNPADTQNLRHGKTVYEVKSGDTLISVASSFGISPATIMVENKLNQGSIIKTGQQLTILPIDGISYTLKETDSLEALATKYKIALDDLLEVNDLELATDAQAGDNIIIPTAVSIPKATTPRFITSNSGRVALTIATAPADLKAANLSFIWPTATKNITQGFSSRHSGIDVSNSKLVSIFAAEAGFVEVSGFENNGYGNTIVINHGNGFKTRYGHASELYVKAGDRVTKNQVIAKQGRTGRVRGVTGIHLHFEIMVNGRRVNPLTYIKP